MSTAKDSNAACHGKVGYTTRGSAERGRARLKNSPYWDGTRLGTYHCTLCNFWHVGHRLIKCSLEDCNKEISPNSLPDLADKIKKKTGMTDEELQNVIDQYFPLCRYHVDVFIHTFVR